MLVYHPVLPLQRVLWLSGKCVGYYQPSSHNQCFAPYGELFSYPPPSPASPPHPPLPRTPPRYSPHPPRPPPPPPSAFSPPPGAHPAVPSPPTPPLSQPPLYPSA